VEKLPWVFQNWTYMSAWPARSCLSALLNTRCAKPSTYRLSSGERCTDALSCITHSSELSADASYPPAFLLLITTVILLLLSVSLSVVLSTISF